MIRSENTEDRKQWAQCLVFLKEQFKRDKSSQVFEKFVAVPEARCHEELFVSDPQDYDYEQVQIKPTRPKESSRKGFDIEGIQLGGEEVGSTRNSEGDSPGLTRQRSSEKLSDDSDEEDMNSSRQNKANKEPDGVQKEEITDIFKSLANIVSTQDVRNYVTQTATGMFSKARNFFGL